MTAHCTTCFRNFSDRFCNKINVLRAEILFHYYNFNLELATLFRTVQKTMVYPARPQ